jgi:flavin-dependent dehydrogenase
LLARNLVENGVAWGYGPRRKTLDKILVEAAVDSGAELRERFSVDDYVFDDGKMVGIRGRGPNGREVVERGTITIGADGRNSKLARTVQAPIYNHVPPILCYYFSYWSGVEAEDFELYIRDERRVVIFAFKTENDLFAIFVGTQTQELARIRHDIEGSFMGALEVVPQFAERVRAGHREERFYGASDLPNFYRKPYGPGWALVGDAGLHKDPFLALGICDALRDVELLASAICKGLEGKQPMLEALTRYETSRNDASALDYKENLAAARFTPPPAELLAIRAAVRNRPEEATRLIKARQGMIRRDEFFNPQNLQRLLGAQSAII